MIILLVWSDVIMNTIYANTTANGTKTMEQIWNSIRDYLNLPTNEQLSNIDWLDVSSILAKIGLVLTLIVITCFVMWLLRAIGLYTMARNNKDDLAWTAFIPFACFFTTGRIVGDTSIYGIKLSKTEWVLPVIMLGMVTIHIKMFIYLIIFILAYYGILYRLYQKQSKENADILIILSILLPILQPFIIFFIRNENKNEPKVKTKNKEKA
jgi:glucan phosphoethanolaminetransferase (alkaline phosphatase superfamily)